MYTPPANGSKVLVLILEWFNTQNHQGQRNEKATLMTALRYLRFGMSSHWMARGAGCSFVARRSRLLSSSTILASTLGSWLTAYTTQAAVWPVAARGKHHRYGLQSTPF